MNADFQKEVGIKYQVYNSLFLGLPFDTTHTTGVHLPILLAHCEQGLAEGKSPDQIIEAFFAEAFSDKSEPEKRTILFNLIQYIERQVVLFDAVEDAAFDRMNDLEGEGTVANLEKKLRYRDRIEAFIEKINDFTLHVVLTAHPTQFYPSTVLYIINSLDSAIRANDIQKINDLLIQLGKTPFLKKEKPTPYDEAVSLIWYLENVFYDSAASIVKQIKNLLVKNGATLENKKLITLGFWPGGDRDGNPSVTSEITRKVITELKRALFRRYYADVVALRKKLTFKHTEELLLKIEERLYHGLYDPALSYPVAEELMADMLLVRNSIGDHHNGIFLEDVDDFLLKIELFGVHFAGLDIRQDSRVQRALIQSVLNKRAPELGKRLASAGSTDAVMEDLSKLKIEIDLSDAKDELEKDVLHSLSDMHWAQKQNGSESCRRYIISNCKSALNVIEVLQLANWSAWQKTQARIDIIPLFESIEDLERAPGIMQSLYCNELYTKHLAQRDNKQTIMLGFSDGTKDGGYMSANWHIHQAKERISEVSRNAGIKAAFFDGRGGPPARGGGNTNKFYSSLGSSIEHKEIQLTIQGQTISSNFGTIVSARYNLEQLLTAGIHSDVFRGEISDLSASQKKLISEISHQSLLAYQELKNDPKFLDYLQQLGTLDYYSLTNISSRPAKRKTENRLTLEDLRAIPFVGTWSQLKQNVPGYYGVGSALKYFEEQKRLDEVAELYKHNQFFRTLIDNCMQVLMKTNFSLTQHFSKHPEFGSLWNKIHVEFELTCVYLLRISESQQLMENNPSIRASITLREKMVLPLLVIQQAALHRLNSSNENDQQTVKDYNNLILRSMFGIINAGRNSV